MYIIAKSKVRGLKQGKVYFLPMKNEQEEVGSLGLVWWQLPICSTILAKWLPSSRPFHISRWLLQLSHSKKEDKEEKKRKCSPSFLRRLRSLSSFINLHIWLTGQSLVLTVIHSINGKLNKIIFSRVTHSQLKIWVLLLRKEVKNICEQPVVCSTSAFCYLTGLSLCCYYELFSFFKLYILFCNYNCLFSSILESHCFSYVF